MIEDEESDDGFLQRWSQRKQALRQGVSLPPDPQPPVQDAPDKPIVADPAAVAPTDEEPVLTDADMPPLESLNEESDYSGFLSPGVSEELRRLALRKLFLSPIFNVRDGLDDYDEDFRTYEKLGDILTADMKFRQELEAQLKAGEEKAVEAVDGEAQPTAEDDSQTAVAEHIDEDMESDVEDDNTLPTTGPDAEAADEGDQQTG